MKGSSIDISGELTISMDIEDPANGVSEPLVPPLAESFNDKQDKLQKLRKKMDERMNQKKKEPEEPKGRDVYLQKVTNFLITSFFLNLAIEHVLTYSLVHDYVNGYLQNKTYLWNGQIEGNNFCFILFYFFRLIGFVLTDWYLIDAMQGDVKEA